MIISVLAIEIIVAGTTKQSISTDAAIECIISGSTKSDIIIFSANNVIVTRPANKCVAPFTSIKVIIPCTAIQSIISIQTIDTIIASMPKYDIISKIQSIKWSIVCFRKMDRTCLPHMPDIMSNTVMINPVSTKFNPPRRKKYFLPHAILKNHRSIWIILCSFRCTLLPFFVWRFLKWRKNQRIIFV